MNALGKSLFSIFLCFLFGLFATSAHGVDVTGNVNFGGPTQDFNLGMTVAPGSTITVWGGGEYHLWDEWWVQSHLDVDIPWQQKPISLNPDTVTFSSNPVGSATVGFDDATLANGTLSDTVIDFQNGATWDFQFDPITFDVDIETIGNVGLKLDISGSITAFSFAQDPGTEPAASGAIYNLPGFFLSSYTTSIYGEALDVIGGLDFDLGEMSSSSDTSNSSGDLPGIMTLTDLGGPAPSDLGVDLDLDLSGLPPAFLTFPLDTSGQTVQNEGHGSGNLDLTIDYVVDADLVLSNLFYALNGSLAGVVVPEPGSFVLMSLGMLGATTWRRRQRKQRI